MKITQRQQQHQRGEHGEFPEAMALTGQRAQHHHDEHADDQAGRLDQQRERHGGGGDQQHRAPCPAADTGPADQQPARHDDAADADEPPAEQPREHAGAEAQRRAHWIVAADP